MGDTTSTAAALGPRFAQALATKDADALRAALHPAVVLRAVTPNRFWEAHGREAVFEFVFGDLFCFHY